MSISKNWISACIILLCGMALGTGISELRHRPATQVWPADGKRSTSATQRRIDSSVLGPTRILATNDDSARNGRIPTLSEALGIKDKMERRRSFEDLGIRLAGTDLKRAFAMQRGLASVDQQALIRGVFHVLAAGDRAAALHWISDCDARARMTAFDELARAWNPDGQPSLSPHWYIGSGFFEDYLLKSDPPQTDLALLWADQLKGLEGKDLALTDIAKSMLETSPAEALKVGDRLHGEKYVDFVTSLTESWAEKDPQAALTWSNQIQDPVLQASVQQKLAEKWAGSDVDSAKAQLQIQPAGSVRETLLASVAGKLAASDTKAAFAWVNTLSNPAERTKAQEVIQNVAPIGIGAQLGSRDSWPMIESIVANSPSAVSGQIHEEDRILAVDPQGNGNFVSTQGMDTDKVKAMITGQAGTAVRLQVTSLNEDGFDAPRVVQLTREQVMLKGFPSD